MKTHLQNDRPEAGTLAPAAAGGNSYSGGTVLTEGRLSASADNALGAASGGVTFNGGTLQFGSSFDLAATRAITIAAGGGTIGKLMCGPLASAIPQCAIAHVGSCRAASWNDRIAAP